MDSRKLGVWYSTEMLLVCNLFTNIKIYSDVHVQNGTSASLLPNLELGLGSTSATLLKSHVKLQEQKCIVYCSKPSGNI